MTKKNIVKLFPQSTSHQPPTASPLGWDLEYSWTFSILSLPAYQSFRYSLKQIKLVKLQKVFLFWSHLQKRKEKYAKCVVCKISRI
jgi:hypothetical protein